MEQLARAIHPGTTASQINKLEKRQVALTTTWMVRIGDALGVHPSELVWSPLEPLRPDTRAVAQIYEGLREEDQAAFRRLGDALAKSAPTNDHTKQRNGG